MDHHDSPGPRSLGWLVDELKDKQNKCGKTLIYCQTVKVATKVFTDIIDSRPDNICSPGLVMQYYAGMEKEDTTILTENFCPLGPKPEVRCVWFRGQGRRL